jgi:hypothetical protein
VGVLVDAKSPTHSSTNEIKASCRIVAIHVSHLSREKHEIPGRAQESARSVLITPSIKSISTF